jgi:glucose-6-phosphate isomerase
VTNVVSQKFFLNDPILKQNKEAVRAAAKELLTTESLTTIFKPSTDVSQLEYLAKKIKVACKHLVIIGTGASSNIPRILFSLVPNNKEFQVYYLEDTDSFKFENIISKLDHNSTRFLVITKSGRTIEILALLSLCLEWAEKKLSPQAISKMFYFITDKQENNYALNIANKIKAKVIDHPALSGRYSFFSSVGLLPAALAGFNVNLILKHAQWCIGNLFQDAAWILDGASYLITMSKKYHNNVLMTYSSIFRGLGLYFRQLISESLGKDGQGVNPVLFEGNIDQHSQLQSYLDGPSDKSFTILTLNKINDNTKIIAPTISDLAYLKNKTLSDVNLLQINSVINLLKKAKKNIRLIEVTNFNERFIAEIVTCFMLETILYAKLNNIDPFTQTAIDCMKNAVRSAAT